LAAEYYKRADDARRIGGWRRVRGQFRLWENNRIRPPAGDSSFPRVYFGIIIVLWFMARSPRYDRALKMRIHYGANARARLIFTQSRFRRTVSLCWRIMTRLFYFVTKKLYRFSRFFFLLRPFECFSFNAQHVRSLICCTSSISSNNNNNNARIIRTSSYIFHRTDGRRRRHRVALLFSVSSGRLENVVYTPVVLV